MVTYDMAICHGELLNVLCHGDMSLYFVICHEGMSWSYMSWRYVMASSFISVCHAGVSCVRVMHVRHGDISLYFFICHVGMSW